MLDFDHNPDVNPNWTPEYARRIYQCRVCGTQRTIETNHTGTVWNTRCGGTCRDIINPHSTREMVYPARRPHDFVGDAP